MSDQDELDLAANRLAEHLLDGIETTLDKAVFSAPATHRQLLKALLAQLLSNKLDDLAGLILEMDHTQ